MFNPPIPVKPDWGETLRGLGILAVVLALLWYWGGSPAIDGYRPDWLQTGFDSYGSALLAVIATLVSFTVLQSFISHPQTNRMLGWPARVSGWTARQVALGLGVFVFAVVTGVGLGAFS